MAILEVLIPGELQANFVQVFILKMVSCVGARDAGLHLKRAEGPCFRRNE